jgi:hypothetical protein
MKKYLILQKLASIAAIVMLVFLPNIAFADEDAIDCSQPECRGCGSDAARNACMGGSSGGTGGDTPLLPGPRPIRLIQIFDPGTTTIQPEPGIQPFFTYFNMIWPWILGIAAGIGVLQALIGGIQIMLSGGDSGKREEGKSKVMWATAGLVMIGLSGLILETLNSTFFVQV